MANNVNYDNELIDLSVAESKKVNRCPGYDLWSGYISPIE